MNYIWDLIIKAKNQGVDHNKVTFTQAEIYSPYMEMSFENLNFNNIEEDSVIEINAWYRYLEIFKDLLNVNFEEHKDVKEVLFDIIIHYLGSVDLYSGISKIDIYKALLFKDIKTGILGNEIKESIEIFNKVELDIFLDGLVNIYKCNTSLHTFKKVLREIFKNSIVYINKSKPKDIYVYIGEKYSKEKEGKLNIINNTFLPINMNKFIFWDKHFGILGLDETMKIENIVMVN